MPPIQFVLNVRLDFLLIQLVVHVSSVQWQTVQHVLLLIHVVLASQDFSHQSVVLLAAQCKTVKLAQLIMSVLNATQTSSLQSAGALAVP